MRRDVPARFTDGRFYAEDYEADQDRRRGADAAGAARVFHKDPYGTRGLSSRIWRMILGEHRTFVLLRQDGSSGAPVPDRGAHHGGSHRSQAGPAGTAPLTPADPEQSARHHHQGVLAFLVAVGTAIIRDFLDNRSR